MPKQRAHGDGSLYSRVRNGKTYWIGRVRHAGRVYEVGATTRAEARRKLEAVKQATARGRPVRPVRQTTGEYLMAWLEHHKADPHGLSPTTLDGYTSRIKVNIIPRLGTIPLADLGVQHISKFLLDLSHQAPDPATKSLRTRLSAYTIRDVRTVLGTALEQAVQWGLIAFNPVRLAKAPRLDRRRQHGVVLDADGARRLLHEVHGESLEAFYTVALACGLRKGEALGLQWSDIDLSAGTLCVRSALYRTSAGLALRQPKTESSIRTIAPLPLFALRALQRHQARQTAEAEDAGEAWQQSGLVFTNSFGGAIEPRNLNRHFAGLLKRADLPHMRVHDLRHSCATLLLLQGVELKVVQEILGHSSIRVTADMYAHVLPQLRAQAAQAMDDLFDIPTAAQAVNVVELEPSAASRLFLRADIFCGKTPTNDDLSPAKSTGDAAS
jgi:integrase